MNIAIISLVFPPETGSARRVGELARWLENQGHHVSVVTGYPSYPKGIVLDGYRKKLIETSRWSEGVEVHRVYLHTSPNRQSFYHRLLHYLSFTFTSILGGFCSPHPDIIYVISPPYFLGLSGWLIGLFRGARLVFDVQDFWPEAPIALGYVRNRWLIEFLVGLERFVYSRSDLIFALSPIMRKKIIERGAAPEKIFLVYNWVDLDRYAPTNGDGRRNEHALVGKFVVLFAGNIGQAQGLDVALDAAMKLRDHTDIVFALLGDGVERPRLQERARSLDLGNVRFLDAVSEDIVPSYLGMADALLVTLGRAKHRDAALPSKVQVYMASARPLIVAAEGATAQTVMNADCGIVVAPDDPTALASAVLDLRDMPQAVRHDLGANGRKYAELHFDYAQQCRFIESRLQLLAGLQVSDQDIHQ